MSQPIAKKLLRKLPSPFKPTPLKVRRRVASCGAPHSYFRPATQEIQFRGIKLHFSKTWKNQSIQIAKGKIPHVHIPVEFHLEIPDPHAAPSIFLTIMWQPAVPHSDTKTLNRAIDTWLMQVFSNYQACISGMMQSNSGRFLIVGDSPNKTARLVQDIIDTFNDIESGINGADAHEHETKIIQRNPAEETLLLVERFRAEVDQFSDQLEETARMSRLQMADRMEPAYAAKLIRVERARKALADFAAGTLNAEGQEPYDVLHSLFTGWKTVKIPLAEREEREAQILKEWRGDVS